LVPVPAVGGRLQRHAPAGGRRRGVLRARRRVPFRPPHRPPGVAPLRPARLPVSRRSFEESVRWALDTLPPAIAARLENVAIVVEEEDPDDPDLLGVFREEPHLPAQIAIFRRPLQESFPDAGELEEEIRVTVLHELAHYFGMDEDQIADLGYD